jgi:ketosteroid isomerase-like protein
VRAVWQSLQEHFPGHRFETEDIFGAGDRCACRWTMHWPLAGGGEGTARGVDIFTVRDGKIAEKLTYVTM